MIVFLFFPENRFDISKEMVFLKCQKLFCEINEKKTKKKTPLVLLNKLR